MVYKWYFYCQLGDYIRLFQHTELEHTPSNLYQQAISRDSFHNWRTGDCLGCALGVCCNFLGQIGSSFYPVDKCFSWNSSALPDIDPISFAIRVTNFWIGRERKLELGPKTSRIAKLRFFGGEATSSIRFL